MEVPVVSVQEFRDAWRHEPLSDEEAARLAALYAQGQAAWPSLALSPQDWTTHLVARRASTPPDEAGSPLEWLERVLPEDAFLAIACERGDSRALVTFEQHFSAELRRLVARYRGPDLPEEDLRQHLRERLFVDDPERPAKLRSYSCRGSLRSWLQVTGVRLFIDMLRVSSRRHKDVPSYEDGQPLDLADAADDPELQFLKIEYRAQFKEAFARAAQRLTSEERNLLRMHLVAGLSIDQIGMLQAVHRATAARRIARARELLLEHTREELVSALKLSSGDEFDSIMNLIRSRLDLSMHRLLQTVTHET